MGFNYLQTDDRDDYFAQFERKHKVKKDKVYSLTDQEGNEIFKDDYLHKLKNYSKRYWIKGKVGEKKKWRQYLIENGYTITSK